MQELSQIDRRNKTYPYMIPVGKEDDSRLDSLSAMFNSQSITWCKKSDIGNKTRALDVGCGNGALTIPLALSYPNLSWLGIDISSEQIEIAKIKANEKSASHIKWKVCDVYDLKELKSDNPKLFDVVHSRFVLTHLDKPTIAIDSMMDVLEPGGVILLEEFGEQIVYEVNSDSENSTAKKAMEAFSKMIDLQAKMQKSHKINPKTVEEHLKDKTTNLTIKLMDCTAKDSITKDIFKKGVENGIKKIKELQMPQLIEKFGYQNAEEWLEDMDNLVKNDTIAVTIKNVTYVSAIKK